MTSAQLARRLGVSQPSIVGLEQSEARGTIELTTLRRVAEALDCTLVYALVPNKPLEETIRDRARRYFDQPEHATLLTPEEMRDLIPSHIAFRQELNQAEQENILRGQDWALSRRRELLSEKFIRELHRGCSVTSGAGQESFGAANETSESRFTKSR